MTAPGPGRGPSDSDPEARDGGDAARVARTLQEGLAPRSTPSIDGFSLQARYLTGGVGNVGGDWYDVIDHHGGLALIIGDVAGHGISAATSMAKLRHAALAYLFEDQSPSSVLARLSGFAAWSLPGEVATVLIAWIPPEAGIVVLASAGHLPPLLLKDGDATFLSAPRGPALGLGAAEYAEDDHPFAAGAALLLYTDGIVERRGETIDAGLERLARIAVETTGDADLCDRIVSVLPDRPGDDDLALVMVRRNEET